MLLNAVCETTQRSHYMCDPVMGSPEKGCLPRRCHTTFSRNIVPAADVIVPNQLNRAICYMDIRSLEMQSPQISTAKRS